MWARFATTSPDTLIKDTFTKLIQILLDTSCIIRAPYM